MAPSKQSLWMVLRSPAAAVVAGTTALLIFDVNYYLMSTMLGTRNNACAIGANLTPFNIGFSGVMSILAGVMIVGIGALIKKKRNAAQAVSLSGFGFVSGIFTLFCTVCILPLITIFGVAIDLGFFTTYNVFFNTASLMLFVWGLWLLNRKLACERCVS